MHCSTWQQPCVSRPCLSRLVGLCLAGVLPVSLAACGAGSVSGSEPVPAPVTPQTATTVHLPEPESDPTAYYELPEGVVRVIGVVFSAGENMLQRRPFQSGVVIAMTQQRYQQFQLDARGPWKSGLLKGRDFPIPARLLAEADVHRCDLDAGGTYALTIPPGDYVLCLAELSEVQQASPTCDDLWVDRVFEAVVTDEDLQTIVPILDRSTGELTLDY